MSKVNPNVDSTPPTYIESNQQYGYPYPSAPPPDVAQQPNTSYPAYASSQVQYNGGTDSHIVFAADAADGLPSVPEDVKHAETFLAFSERSIRMGFIRKVYSILTLQLLVTFGIICLFNFVDDIKKFCIVNWWMIWVSFGVMILCMVLLCFMVSARRKYPLNIILLVVFTLCESFAVATITTYYSVTEVMIAFGVTMLITVSITIFTLQTKFDFTFCAVAVYMTIIFAMLFGCLTGFYYGFGWYYRCYPVYFLTTDTWTYTCYSVSYWYLFMCGLFILLFSFYLALDTNLMIGGKHEYGISPEEYIFAALNLYLDIIRIFLYILLLLGGTRN